MQCELAFTLVTKDDAGSVCGSKQLCAGLKCGIEGAIHTATDLFHSHNDWGMLMMDARNAFNSIKASTGSLYYGTLGYYGPVPLDIISIFIGAGPL